MRKLILIILHTRYSNNNMKYKKKSVFLGNRLVKKKTPIRYFNEK